MAASISSQTYGLLKKLDEHMYVKNSTTFQFIDGNQQKNKSRRKDEASLTANHCELFWGEPN
jgi:transposase